MANPFDTLGIPLEEKEKEQSNITSTSPSTSDNNPFNNLGENFTEPSAVRMAQYGASQETYLLGDLKRLTSAGIQSIFSDKSFSEERKEEEDKRLKELYEIYPEFETGRYESNPYVWAGRAGVMITDPVYWLMPWTRAAQAGKLLGRGGYELAKLGAGVGVVDATTRDLARNGEVRLSSVAWGAGGGALLAPATTAATRVIGAGLNKAFPNLFKDKAKEVEKILTDTHKKNYNVDDEGLKKLYNISELPNIKRAFANSVNLQNNYQNIVLPMVNFVDEIARVTDITKALKTKKNLFDSFKKIADAQDKGTILTKGTKPYKFKLKSLGGKTLEAANIKDIQKFSTQIKNELNEFAYKSLKEQAEATTKLQIQITKEIHKQSGLTGEIGRILAVNFTRPLVGGAGGGTLGTLFTDSDEGFYAFVGLGLAVGGLNRVLMRGGIKGIPKLEQVGFAKALKKEYFTNLDRSLRILFSSTQQTSLTNRGPILDRFANLIFDRPTDTVRLQGMFRPKVSEVDNLGLVKSGTNVETNIQMQMATFSRAIVDDVIQGASKEVQANAVKIVRGASETFDLQSQQMAVRIREFLNKFRTYYKDVGFTEKELLDFYFPRQYNFRLINASKENQDEFLDLVTQAFKNVTKNASTKSPVVLGSRTVTKVVKNKTITKTVDNKITKPFDDKAAREAAENHLKSISDSQDEIISFAKTINGQDSDLLNYKTFQLPLTKHVAYERMLKGSYDDVEKVLEKYLINDVGAVLHSLTRESVKSVEFARVFGPKGELIEQFVKQLREQYKREGFQRTTTGGYGSQYVGDVKAIKNAVNSLFGRYGRVGKPQERAMTAVLSSLANFNMMDKVTLANFGDLIQPFQNSRYLSSAFLGAKSIVPFRENNLTRNLALQESKLVQQNLKDAYVGFDDRAKEFSTKSIKNEKFIDIVRAGNEKFFKYIGLEEITNTARRYAYTVGIIDSHKTAKSLVKYLRANNLENFTNLNQITKQSALKDLQHLVKTGAVRVDGQGNIINKNTLIKFGSFKNVDDASKDTLTLSLMDRIGTQAANRDAIIPQVGNRLLFTQTRSPFMRLLGQFSSWAMAKSAQTNAMLSRVEDGDLRTAIGMVGSLVAFGGVHDLREFAKTGEFGGYDKIENNTQEYLAHALQMSGNIGWLPTFVANAFVGWSAGRPMDFVPAASMFKDIAEFGAKFTGALFNVNSYDAALKELYDFLPAPTVRRIIDRLGVPGFVYKKDINILNAPDRLGNPDSVKLGDRVNLFSKGGVADKRMSFSEGGFADAFAEARGNKQELFTWQGNSYTTRRADETDQQYQNFLGKSVDNKVILKEEPYAPADQKEYNNVLAGNAVVDTVVKGNKMFVSNVPAGNEVIKKIVDDLKTEELKENPNRIFIEELPPQVYGIDTTFSEAFKDARKNLGPNATFSWQGKTYSTARADDKKVKEKPQQIIPKKKPIVALYEPKEIESMSFAKKIAVMNETTAGKFALLDLAWANTPPPLRPKNSFTEKNFSSAELNVIKNLVLNSMANKVNNVSVERGDYNVGSENWAYGSQDNRIKESRGLTKLVYQHTGSNRATFDILRTLGGFTFSVNDKGETIVTDTYDFNDAKGMFSGSNWKKLYKNITGKDSYGSLRAAMSIFGSSEGNGRKFEINLGVLNTDEPKKFRGGGLYQGGRSHSFSSGFAGAKAAMTSNKAYTGGGNGGSSSNNNNNNNSTVKTSSTNTTTKGNKKGKEGVILQTNIPTPKDSKKERKNKTLDLLQNQNVKAKAGYFIEGQGNYADAFIEGQSLLSSSPVMTGNINYANKNYGIDIGASYNFNENNFTGSATKTFQPVGMTQEGLIKPYIGVNYDDGDFSPTAGVKISFKRGGLLDKKRG